MLIVMMLAVGRWLSRRMCCGRGFVDGCWFVDGC